VGSLCAAIALLFAVWVIAILIPASHTALVRRPPLVVGDGTDVLRILGHNSLVLALHAMACVAGFIAGSSLPLQAQHHTGIQRAIHEHGGRLAILFVAAATTFSLSAQALVLGLSVSRVSAAIYASPGLLILGLLPHAIPELTALFLPLAAWIIAGRRGEWDRLLAATLVTVALAVPVLVISALWEVYVAPHLLMGLLNYW
jgi:stage II sporulation SpoM-like protein